MTDTSIRIGSGPGVFLALAPGLTYQIKSTDWRATVNGTRKKKTAEERFWPRVQVTGFCWEWTGSLSYGYGHFNVDRKSVRAHRFSYETLVGPIPEGLVIDHLCRNRACVNPDHLEPVTNRENNIRGYGFMRSKVEATHCPLGHPYSGRNLYVTPRGKRDCRECRRMADNRRYYRDRSPRRFLTSETA